MLWCPGALMSGCVCMCLSNVNKLIPRASKHIRWINQQQLISFNRQGYQMTEVNTRTPSQTPLMTQQTIHGSKRVEVESLAFELRSKLGNNWDKYQATIASFLIGKLSRTELSTCLQNLLTDSRLIKMHNQLLLANMVNALRDSNSDSPSIEKNSKYSFGSSSKKVVKKGMKQSNQYEKLKKDVMNLPIRERYRIKTITRDSGKQKMANSSLTLTRQALLPKIPFSSDKEKMMSNVIEWTQDVNHGLHTPLDIETFSLPEQDALKTRILGIAREHGITGPLSNDAAELLYHGLETYLKNIVEAAIDTVRYRKRRYNSNDFEFENLSNVKVNEKKPKITLVNEDMIDTFDIMPYLVEPSGPVYRLHSVMLKDDCYVEPQCSLDDEAFECSNAQSSNKQINGTGSNLSSPLIAKVEKSNKDVNVTENVGDREELNLLIRDILLKN